MASINTVRAILSAIRGASHSQSVAELSATTRERESTVHAVVADLVRNGYIKEHSQRPGTYFTRTPKRGQIAGFIDGTATLPGITFDTPVATAPTATTVSPVRPTETTAGLLAKRILQQIKSAPHALPDAEVSVLGYTQPEINRELTRLQNAKVIKFDDEQSGYFTRKPMRTKIDRFLADLVTVDQLLDPALKNMPEMARATEPEAEPVHTPSAPSAPVVACPAIVAPEPVVAPNVETHDHEFTAQPRAASISGLDDLISELIMVRDNAASMAVRACDEFLSGLR